MQKKQQQKVMLIKVKKKYYKSQKNGKVVLVNKNGQKLTIFGLVKTMFSEIILRANQNLGACHSCAETIHDEQDLNF